MQIHHRAMTHNDEFLTASESESESESESFQVFSRKVNLNTQQNENICWVN